MAKRCECGNTAKLGTDYCTPCHKERYREAYRREHGTLPPPRQRCQHCGNSAKWGADYCRPCQSHQNHVRLRERVYSGERVSHQDWERIVDEDTADAAFEAYKWSIRDGDTTEQAADAADRAAAQVLKLHRKARHLELPDEERQKALDLLAGGHTARRAGQQAAATMIRQAAWDGVTSGGSHAQP